MREGSLIAIGIAGVVIVACLFINSVYNYNKAELDLKAKQIEVEKSYAQAGLVQRVDVTGRVIWTVRP